MPQHRLELKVTSSRAFQKTTIKFMNPYLVTCPYLLWNLTLAKKLLVNDKENVYPERYI